MALNVPIDRQDVGNPPSEDEFCPDCGGELELVEDHDVDEMGPVNLSYFQCTKCGWIDR